MKIWTVHLRDKDGKEYWKQGIAGNFLAAGQKAKDVCEKEGAKELEIIQVQALGEQEF